MESDPQVLAAAGSFLSALDNVVHERDSRGRSESVVCQGELSWTNWAQHKM